MHFQIKLYTIILISTLFFTACSSDTKEIIENKNIELQSGEIVTIKGINAKAYSWRQVSGIDVILIDSNTDTLSFIAPDVQKEEILTFELQALITSLVTENIVKKDIATVTIKPNTQTDETDTTIPSHEDTTQDETNTTTPNLEEVTKDTSKYNEVNTTIPSHEDTTQDETNTTNKADTVKLKSIKLTLNKTSLNIETNTSLKVIATYQDNTTKDVTNQVEWIYTDKQALDIKNNILKTLHKDTNIFIQAKLNNITSNQVALEIYKEISGHRLPPELNPAINNATLLGIDSNNNGVRDDVERKIYAVYKRPVEQAYMMQYAVRYPQTLEDPVAAAKSKELEKEHWNLYSCKGYLIEHLDTYMPENSVSFMENAYFNTKERMRAYVEFNEAFSGGVYNIPFHDEDMQKENCDFNITKMLEIE